MKVSAALQILTTVMSGTGNADDWSSSQHVQQPGGDFAPRLDLDLGACLDVETLEEFNHNMYNDADTQPDDNAWVEDVIDMTSSSELTSSGDHSGVVPNSEEMARGGFLPSQSGVSALDNFDFMDGLTATDNATYVSMDTLTSAAGAAFGTSLSDSSVPNFAQFGSLSSAALSSTTTTSTIDLTALEQFVTLDVDATSQQTLGNSDSVGSNIPSALWNLDLTQPLPEERPSTSTAGVQDVKETLKNRLYSRGSLNSVSQDSDVMACSTRSLSSPTSSLTQSFDDEDADDPTKALEKREKNRVAAQKCRNKKREKTETLQKSVARLEERQERLKEEVQKLRDERETLEEIINIHGMVCPKIRKISSDS